MYRITTIDVQKQQDVYKKNYAPFKPFNLSDTKQKLLGERYANILTTQNGPDTDDYGIDDTNKVTTYLGSYPKGSRVLLLGVGTGREVMVAKEDFGFDVTGITFGSRNIDFGRQYLKLNEKEFTECSVEILPFARETFDIVAGFQVFEHAISPLLFLLQLGRVLKNGGTLVLEWPPACEAFTGGSNPHHQVCFTPGQAKGLLQKAGFGNIELTYCDKTIIPESEYWQGNQNKMLVVKGIKELPKQEYIKKAWGE